MSLDRDMKLIGTKKIHTTKGFAYNTTLKKISTSLEQEATKFINLPHTS